MTKDDDQKRLEEIRDRYMVSSETAARDIYWLLDKLAERNARIAELEKTLTYIAKKCDKMSFEDIRFRVMLAIEE